MSKALWGIIPIIVLSLIITLWMGYSEKVDELISSNEKNETLESANDKLTDTTQKNKVEIEKLIMELKHTQLLLERREKALKELQADVYKQFKNLEMLGEHDPAIRNILRNAIPDGVWAEVFVHSNCDNPEGNSQTKSSNSPVEAVPRTQTP